MRNVSINLKKDENIIKIEENTKQEDILKELTQKLPELKKLYKDEKTPIRIIGKVLKNKEMDEIELIVKSYLDVEIRFDMPKELGLSSIIKTFSKTVDISETKFYKGSLRSGKKIEVEGSVVILGDVNSGAEIMATENIVVLGSLRGLAHAGAKGNKGSIIAAGKLDAVQLRIANIVKELDKEEIIQEQVYIHVETSTDGDKILVEKF